MHVHRVYSHMCHAQHGCTVCFLTLTQCLVSFEGVQPPPRLWDPCFSRFTILDDYSLRKYGNKKMSYKHLCIHVHVCVWKSGVGDTHHLDYTHMQTWFFLGRIYPTLYVLVSAVSFPEVAKFGSSFFRPSSSVACLPPNL